MSEKPLKELSVIVPVYNEESAIADTLENLKDFISRRAAEGEFEIIVIDDGSTDATFEKASSVRGVQIIRRPRNIGYGAAIKTGVRQAKFGWVLVMDGDGQHTTESIQNFIAAVEEGYDMAIGARQKISHQLWYRQPGKQLLKIVANFLADQKIQDLNSGMRIFNKKLFAKYEPLYPNGFSITTAMTLAFMGDGYAVKFVPITTLPRVGRKSNVRFIRDGFNTLVIIMRAICLFNPLRVFVPASLVCTGIGLYYGITNMLKLGRLSGTSIVCIVLGVMVFLFGILADQLALLRKQQGNFSA